LIRLKELEDEQNKLLLRLRENADDSEIEDEKIIAD
jgi:hypothetical protein